MNIPFWSNRAARTGASANILIRIVVGGVFLNEGLLKFLDPMTNATGRFAAIGIPAPQFFGPLVATVETVGGLLLCLGLLTQSFPLFLDERRAHLRRTTHQDYKTTLTSFAFIHGRRKLLEIGTGDIIDFLKSRGVTGKTWNNLRADLNAFFVWCEKPPRKWIVNNPVKDVEKFEIVQGIPEVLSTEKVKALFAFLETYRGSPRKPLEPGCLVPYFALATFAGLRPAINGGEITRIAKLKNQERIIDLQAGVFRITPELAKTRDVRQIMIQPCLRAWLTRYPIARFPIIPPNACNLLGQVRRKFAIGHDALRHAFVSMHVAKFRSMGDTALQAGNSEAIIKKHYLNLVSPDEADAFWKLVPLSGLQAAASFTRI